MHYRLASLGYVETDKMVIHILKECSKLAPKENKIWHDLG